MDNDRKNQQEFAPKEEVIMNKFSLESVLPTSNIDTQ